MGSVFAAPRLWSTGLIAVAQRLSCSVARGIFLDQGLNSCLLHWQAVSSPLVPYGKHALLSQFIPIQCGREGQGHECQEIEIPGGRLEGQIGHVVYFLS